MTENSKAIGLTKLSVWQATKLQWMPGLASMIVFLPSVYIMGLKEIPTIFALGLAILVAEVPISWMLIVRHVRVENDGNFSFSAAFPWAEKLKISTYIFVGIPLIVFGFIAMAMGQMRVGSIVRDSYFDWVPEWLILDAGMDAVMAMPQHVLLMMLGMSIFVFTLIGGFTQELYARGFLLPRMAHMGIGAPLLNATNFAIFHFAAPWNWPVFFAVSLAWSLLVYFMRSVRIGLVGHIGMLALQTVALSALVLRGALLG